MELRPGSWRLLAGVAELYALRRAVEPEPVPGRVMMDRLLCRIGIHRWAFFPKISKLDLPPTVHIYIERKCQRPPCEARRYDS